MPALLFVYSHPTVRSSVF